MSDPTVKDDGYCSDCEDVRHCGTLKKCLYGKRPVAGSALLAYPYSPEEKLRAGFEEWHLNYWRKERGFGGRLTEQEHRERLRSASGYEVAFAAWCAATSLHSSRIAELEQRLGNLIARIHRDGGHYIQEHGWTKAEADADAQVVAWLAATDRIAELEEALRELLEAESAPYPSFEAASIESQAAWSERKAAAHERARAALKEQT